jgi:phage terminase large subunit-like protein
MSSATFTSALPRSAQPASKWKPAYFTPRRYPQTDGDELIAFAEAHFQVLKGFRAGGSLEFTNWQKWLLRSLYERNPNNGNRLRYRRALIGLPRKNGKSLMMSAVGVYSMIAGEAGSEIYAVANDRQQARIIFNEAKQQIQNSRLLNSEAKVYRDAIEMPRFGSLFRVLSSEVRAQAGLNPSLTLFDELWGQKNDDLYDQMTLGSGNRLEPMTIGITTAGFDRDSLAGRLYQYGKQVVAGEVDDESFGFWWWEAPEDCDINDRKAWAVANPNLAEGLLDPEDLAAAVRQTAESSIRRWRLNNWTRSQESWLPVGAWEQCVDRRLELEDDLPVFVGIDMALKRDTIAVVVAQPQTTETGDRVVVRAKIWQPEVDGIDVAGVEAYLVELHNRFEVREFAYDPAFFERSAEALSDRGLNMVQYPQTGSRMIPACGQSYELIVAKKIAHDGSPVFTDQVLSAAQRMSANGWTLSKGKSKRKIDACIAMVMAVDRATRKPPPEAIPAVLDIWS